MHVHGRLELLYVDPLSFPRPLHNNYTIIVRMRKPCPRDNGIIILSKLKVSLDPRPIQEAVEEAS